MAATVNIQELKTSVLEDIYKSAYAALVRAVEAVEFEKAYTPDPSISAEEEKVVKERSEANIKNGLLQIREKQVHVDSIEKLLNNNP